MTASFSRSHAGKSEVVIGSESQTQERQRFVTGIQRVICETHKDLTDFFGIDGIRLEWVHTSNFERSLNFKTVPYLAADPVLSSDGVQLSEINGLLILDIPTLVDFSAVMREQEHRDLQVFVLIHDILPLLNPEWFPGTGHRAFKLYIQQVFHVANHIIVTSDHVKNDLENLGWKMKGEIHVIPLGSIHAQRNPTQVPESQISAMYVATVAPRKGHDKLIDAFDILRQRGCDVDLTLIGRFGWDCEDLVNRIHCHPDFGGRLKWLRNADDHVVRETASRCNLAVIPAEGEGFGMFLEEGLTLGLKVVASDIPVFREREQVNVFFAERTGESLADSMVRAAATPWKALDRGEIRTMRDFSRDVADLVSTQLLL